MDVRVATSVCARAAQVRWKPPPAGAPLSGEKHIGWRTEFRSMEVRERARTRTDSRRVASWLP
eukprot:5303712-Pleurochrysis_carterae.AAC.1